MRRLGSISDPAAARRAVTVYDHFVADAGETSFSVRAGGPFWPASFAFLLSSAGAVLLAAVVIEAAAHEAKRLHSPG